MVWDQKLSIPGIAGESDKKALNSKQVLSGAHVALPRAHGPGAVLLTTNYLETQLSRNPE